MSQKPNVRRDFTPGQRVRITVGQFEGYEGQVIGRDRISGEVIMEIEIFGRATPVDVREDLLEPVE